MVMKILSFGSSKNSKNNIQTYQILFMTFAIQNKSFNSLQHVALIKEVITIVTVQSESGTVLTQQPT